MRRLGSVILIAALAGSASAYVREKVNGVGTKWSHLPVPYKINPTADPAITDGSDIAAIKAGFAAWEAANCSDFAGMFAGDTTAIKPVDDGQVEIMWPSTANWVHGSCSSGGCTLAVTNTQFRNNGSGWFISDADIEFTPYTRFSTKGDRYSSDLQSVATHEEGHLLGLDHTSVTSATMYFSTSPGDTSQRTLDTDDLNGVCAIYPNGQTPVGCTTSSQCDSGQLCQNSACVADPSLGAYGTSCRPDGSCTNAGGFCLQYQDGSTVCSQSCGTGCPNNDDCINLQSGGNACDPGTGTTQPPTKKGFGGTCSTGNDCQSGQCANGLCTQTCTPGAAGTCPGGYHCETRPSGSALCMPGEAPKQGLGGSCTSDGQCASNICATSSTNPDDHFCTEMCDPAVGCAQGFACVDAGGGAHACVRDDTAPGGLGAPCDGPDLCNSGICVADGYCTQLCDPAAGCGTGFDCVTAGENLWACAKKAKDGGGSSGGCTVSGGSRQGALGGLALLGLALLLVARRRRRA